MRRIYVVSRYKGDTERNINDAIRACRYVIDRGHMPIAGHLLYPQMLDDNIPEQRIIGCHFGMELLSFCDEAWVFMRDDRVSEGMEDEIREAKRLRKKVLYFDMENIR